MCFSCSVFFYCTLSEMTKTIKMFMYVLNVKRNIFDQGIRLHALPQFTVTQLHYNDVIMGAIAFQITSPTIVYSTVYSDADERKHQSSASLALVWGIQRWPVNSPHKWPVTRKMFQFDDVIMVNSQIAKSFGSLSISNCSDEEVSDRCLIDVDSMVFSVWYC